VFGGKVVIGPDHLTRRPTQESARHGTGRHRITLPADWLQGRTAYGGLSAALCLQATVRSHADLPPLRSAQFCFIGPATGELDIAAAVLRQG
jgi:hypothetical protein